MAGMSDEHRKILQRHRTDLIRDLEPLKLLNDLAECLDEEDRETVKSHSTRGARAEELVDMMPRRGPKAFQYFVAALHKRQPHLAKPLVEESGIDCSTFQKDDVGMTDKHKQILLTNSDILYKMNLEKVVLLLHSSGLLDDTDKESLLSKTRIQSQRIDVLLSEILPRKGPKAFDEFARDLGKVHQEMAHKLREDAAITGSSPVLKLLKSSPVQDTGSFTLESPVQEILEIKPEVFKQFCQHMDEDDIWGNGWKRFYQELNLPVGKENIMEGRDDGPTSNCVKGWVSMKGRDATVQALLAAVYRTKRKDCAHILEENLGCRLDYTDAPVKEVTEKMASLNPSEKKRVEFFGDLDENQASEIVRRLQEEPFLSELLHTELTKDLGITHKLSTQELMQQSKNYRIRKFLDSLTSEETRAPMINIVRRSLPTHKGVTGPLLFPNTYMREVGYTTRRNLTKELCGDDSWKVLAEKLGMDNVSIGYLQQRKENPADEVLRFWEVKAGSTVGALYDILVELGYPYIADRL